MRSSRRLGTALAALGVVALTVGGGTGVAGTGLVVTVTTTADGADIAPGDGTCATAEGECTLRAAVQETNAVAGPDEIVLPANAAHYDLTIRGREDASASGDLDITDSLTITGGGSDGAIIDGPFDGSTRIIHVIEQPGQEVVARISGLQMTDGWEYPAAALYNQGYDTGGPVLYLTDVAIYDHYADDTKVVVNSGGSVMHLTDSEVARSSAFDHGGGILNEGSMTLIRSIVRGHYMGHGGAGGGILNYGRMSLTDSSVNASGGGTASCCGGIDNHGDMILRGVTVASNTPGSSSGGIGNSGRMTIINSTVSDNRVDFQGGGIGNSGILLIRNSTIYDNQATFPPDAYAPGIYSVGGQVRLKNSIVALNKLPDGSIVNCFDRTSSIGSRGYNIEDADTCGLNGTGDLVNTNPLLGPLVDNGGFTFTHALLAGSPAIDWAPTRRCPDLDQRGFPRPVDGDGDGSARCDVGAFEL